MPADRLRQRLADLTFPPDDEARAEVQRCVQAYVDSLKAESWPPERVVIGLKHIADEAGIRAGSLPTMEGRVARADLLMDMVTWSIERYFAPTERES